MRKALMVRGERALGDLASTIEEARGALARRLEGIDIEAMQKRGTKLAGSVRSDVVRRLRPRRQGPSPAAVFGLAVLGLAAAGVGYLIYDRERREAARKRLEGMRSGVRERYAELTGGRTRAETDLEEKVEQAISQGGKAPEGLETVVEGRTVYLRGDVRDPASVDAAAERAHGVPGVVAVVNLTTSRANDKRAPASTQS